MALRFTCAQGHLWLQPCCELAGARLCTWLLPGASWGCSATDWEPAPWTGSSDMHTSFYLIAAMPLLCVGYRSRDETCGVVIGHPWGYGRCLFSGSIQKLVVLGNF